MKIRFVIAIAAAAISWALPAAGAPEEYRVRALSLLPTPPAEVHLHDAGGKGTAGVVHPKSFLNHEYELLKTKGGAVVLTTKADPGSVKVDGDVVGECELPAKAGSYILLMLPEDGSETKSKVVVVDSSAKAFPPGSFKVINTTTVPVKIELEGKPFEFAAGETKLIEKAPMGENQTAGMKASFERDGKWTTISSGVWPAPGDKRVLQILIESGANKRIELRGIRDVAKP
ncbi:hypothetical protein [Luteolibacter luteus]|uniref:DUF4198 domain-containing protein n=1 Tax=Luteolibacter luteus TaxID=2728835 RepID=A0A858RMU9_9BACT|nr:hypothetical protein [Luteolibacter luteus]QJE97303.1 hypothetical protein HHL09_16415 [Luteolibacter luteus]